MGQAGERRLSKVCDERSRREKSKKILAILREFVGDDLSRLRCLDLGCARGLISYYLAPAFERVIGVDVDAMALSGCRLREHHNNLHFLAADGRRLPFTDESFEVVICAQVYEHVTDPQALVREIDRIMTGDGVCFFSGPNRLAPIENHYGLPFLHWLPRNLASWLLRVTGRSEEYEENLLTYWQLRRLLARFEIHDFTSKMIGDPQRYFVVDELGRLGPLRRIPPTMLRRLIFLAPNFNWILTKKR